ncbi:hypothetical protein [Mycobacterium sp. GA-1841]|uniref:hypothetical protein n=1 Tax=Mycobacterium sp. GA-1841 TaxID=1834154 RepID=UPI00096FB28F|nr:hypothetical protein [Mycobacterium sp. GA-1841]
MKITKILATTAIAGGMAAGAVGLSAATAGADPAWAPAPNQPMLATAPPPGPNPGSPPAWAPPTPAQPAWAAGNPQVWDEGWHHWGVWMNGVFVPTF